MRSSPPGAETPVLSVAQHIVNSRPFLAKDTFSSFSANTDLKRIIIIKESTIKFKQEEAGTRKNNFKQKIKQ